MTEHRITIAPGHRRYVRVGSTAKWITDTTLTVAAGDTVIINEQAAPPPPPTQPTFYIAPNGNDTAAGTKEAPWRTILKATTGRAPGDLILARGGTYTGQGGYNWKSSGTASAPVTLRAYPNEVPHFDGTGVSHCIIVSGYNYAVIDGLSMSGFGMGSSGDGAILTLNARGVTVQNCRLTNNGIGFQQDHHIYVNSGCADITVRDNYFDGTPGAAVHIYHDPGPTNVLIEGNEMHNGYWGVVIGSNANGVAMRNNVFSGNTVNMDNQRGTNVTASGNTPSDVVT